MLLFRVTGVGGIYDLSVMCAILGCAAQVCLLAAVLCGSAAIVCPFPMCTAGGLLLWVVCALYPLYHPLLNIFLDIVVLLTDTYTYCLYTHNRDGSF
jgi:hypothetical protein